MERNGPDVRAENKRAVWRPFFWRFNIILAATILAGCSRPPDSLRFELTSRGVETGGKVLSAPEVDAAACNYVRSISAGPGVGVKSPRLEPPIIIVCGQGVLVRELGDLIWKGEMVGCKRFILRDSGGGGSITSPEIVCMSPSPGIVARSPEIGIDTIGTHGDSSFLYRRRIGLFLHVTSEKCLINGQLWTTTKSRAESGLRSAETLVIGSKEAKCEAFLSALRLSQSVTTNGYLAMAFTSYDDQTVRGIIEEYFRGAADKGGFSISDELSSTPRRVASPLPAPPGS